MVLSQLTILRDNRFSPAALNSASRPGSRLPLMFAAYSSSISPPLLSRGLRPSSVRERSSLHHCDIVLMCCDEIVIPFSITDRHKMGCRLMSRHNRQTRATRLSVTVSRYKKTQKRASRHCCCRSSADTRDSRFDDLFPVVMATETRMWQPLSILLLTCSSEACDNCV
ncbi:hypothetical protein NP493_353g02021 [Ridgeia piscesae]|uniref:Uncharacterized protein n=1 Tax=Ridgeia piscesae TaxID=27915 RepID=A0AAD9L413_RIDPI|nr:hypothetical protein NP493_353g02021 [Ridgeia piscesae]